MSFHLLKKVCCRCLWLWETSNKQDQLARGAVTVSLLVSSLLWLLCIWNKLRKGKVHLPPGPRGLPIFGYLPFVGTELHHSFTQLAHSYGPIYKLWLGKKLCIVVSSPALVKEVTRDQDSTFANRAPSGASLATTYGGRDIAWAPYGPRWRILRKIFVSEMLSNKNLDDCYALRRDEVWKAIKNVYKKIGTSIEIGQLVFTTEINVVMNLLWGSTLDGEKIDGVGVEFRKVVSGIFDLLGKPNVSDFYPFLARFDLQGVEREVKRFIASIEKILNSVMDAHQMKKDAGKLDGAKNNETKDFLQFLLELKDQEDNAATLSMTEIKALVIDIVVGGTETTVASSEFVIAEVMKHPEVMAKAQKELAQVVGLDNFVEEFHLPKLKFLNAVVRETLRLHPVGPFLIPRTPKATCTVSGYTIPEGSTVFINVWAIHRDPMYWEDPNKFKPERFLGKADVFDFTGNSFQYLPFGSGRRVCAGLPLAEKMLMFVVASLLHSFDWKLPEDEEIDLSDKFGIVLKKKKPLFAIPTPRLSNLDLYGE